MVLPVHRQLHLVAAPVHCETVLVGEALGGEEGEEGRDLTGSSWGQARKRYKDNMVLSLSLSLYLFHYHYYYYYL